MQKNNAKLIYLKRKKIVLIFFSILIQRNKTSNCINVFFTLN